jgi:hypothetical protein
MRGYDLEVQLRFEGQGLRCEVSFRVQNLEIRLQQDLYSRVKGTRVRIIRSWSVAGLWFVVCGLSFVVC